MLPMSEATRAYIYRIIVAIQPVVVAYGLLTDQLAVLWVGVASAILGGGLAVANTSTSRGAHVADSEPPTGGNP